MMERNSLHIPILVTCFKFADVKLRKVVVPCFTVSQYVYQN